MYQKLAETKLFKYLQDILDALRGGSGGSGGEGDRETPTMLYRVREGQSFTGAIAGDPILSILTIDTATNTLVSNTPIWYNGRTKLPLNNADVDTDKLEVIAANSLTASELATMTLKVDVINAVPSGNTEHGLHLTFDSIANCPVSPANSAAAWNAYLLTDVVQSATVVGNKVILICNGGLALGDSFLQGDTAIQGFQDFSGYVYSCGITFLSGSAVTGSVLLNNLTNVSDTFMQNCSQLTELTAEKLEEFRGGLNNASALQRVTLPKLKATSGAFLGACPALVEVSLPELESVADYNLFDCFSLRYANFPKLKNAGNNFLATENSFTLQRLQASNLVSTGTNFLQTMLASGFVLHLESLKTVGAGSFGGVVDITGTVYTNKEFVKNPIFQAFLALNLITLVIVDEDITTQSTVGANLTSLSTTGATLPVDGKTQFTVSITLGNATTAPIIQLLASYNNADYEPIDMELVGIIGGTRSFSVSGILPTHVKWKVAQVGSGIAYSIITVRAK